MGRTTTTPVIKKKTKSSTSRSIPTTKNRIRNYATYQERVLASLYTLSRRKRGHGKIHLNTLSAYLHKFTKARADHSKMLTPLIHRARKHLEDESLIQVDPHGYLTLKDSVKEGIRVERNEKNDSDDDERATVHYFRTLSPSITGVQPRRNQSSTTATTIKNKKNNNAKKRVASRTASSDDSEVEEKVVKPRKKRSKKIEKVKIVPQVEGDESELSELSDESSEEEESKSRKKTNRGLPKDRTSNTGGRRVSNPALQRLNKAELLRRLEELTAKKEEEEKDGKEVEDEDDGRKDEELGTLATGFKELEKKCESLKTRLARFENINEEEEEVGDQTFEFDNGMMLGEGGEDDRGGMGEMNFDDSGFHEAESVADTEVSDAERKLTVILPLVQPPSNREEDEGFSPGYPLLEINEDNHQSSSSPGPSFLSKHQTQEKKEFQQTHSFNSNRMPSPAYSHAGAESLPRSDDDNRETIRQSTPVPQQSGSNQIQTPALSSSPYKSTDEGLGLKEGNPVGPMEIAFEQPTLETMNELDKVTGIFESFQAERKEREKEKKSHEDYKLELENELEVVRKQYQDLVESSEARIESLTESISEAEEKVSQVEKSNEEVLGEKELLENRLDEARSKLLDLEAQLIEATAAKEEASKLSASRIASLEQSLVELTRSFTSLQESKNVEVHQLTTQNAELEAQLATVLDTRVIRPTIEASVETGQDPALEELRIKLTKEKEQVIEALKKELALTGDRYIELEIRCEETKERGEEVEKELEQEKVEWGNVKLEMDEKMEEVKRQLSVEKQTTASLQQRLDSLERELEVAINGKAQVVAERKGLAERIVVLDFELGELRAKLLETSSSLDLEKIRGLDLEREHTTIVEGLEQDLGQKSEQFLSLTRSLETIATGYGIAFDNPQASLVELSSRLKQIDTTSLQLLRSIIELIPAQVNVEEEDTIGREESDSDLIVDLEKLKKSLVSYVSEAKKLSESSMKLQEDSSRREALLDRIQATAEELQRVIYEGSQDQSESISGVLEVVTLAQEEVTKLRIQVVESKKDLEVMEVEKDSIIHHKSSEVVRVEKEFTDYRETLRMKLGSLYDEMGLKKGEEGEKEVEMASMS